MMLMVCDRCDRILRDGEPRAVAVVPMRKLDFGHDHRRIPGVVDRVFHMCERCTLEGLAKLTKQAGIPSAT